MADPLALAPNLLTPNPTTTGADLARSRVKDTAQASFDVEHYESYVAVQTESAIRTTAARG